MRVQLLFFFSLIVILNACTPQPIFRLSPQTGPSTFHKGVEYSMLEEDDIVVTIAYYRHLGELFAMDLEVLNNGDESLRIDPASFYREAYKHHRDTGLSGLISSRRAADPELRLLEIDKTISRKHASRTTDEALYFTLQGLYVAAEIASDTGYEEIEEEQEQSRIEQEIERQNYRYELLGLEQQRGIWELDALRITDLHPGDYIRGLVFFPHEPKAAGYKIVLNIGDNRFDVWYGQKKYKP